MVTSAEQRFKSYLKKFEETRIKPGLSRMNYLMENLGHPERQFSAVHIAGTNGKGSVGAYLLSSLTAAGYRVGFYTSPHLLEVKERIAVGHRYITYQELGKLLEVIKPFVENLQKKGDPPTYFELLTALACLYFAQEKVDLALVEVGIEGRLDATNVVLPLLTVLSQIELEHQEFLGEDYESVLKEALGLLRFQVPCVSAEKKELARKALAEEVSLKKSRLYLLEREAKFEEVSTSLTGQVFNYSGLSWDLSKVEIGLLGNFQLENASLALLALEVLEKKGFNLPELAIRHGFKKAFWPGRLQLVRCSPWVVVDGAHNPLGVRVFRESLEKLFVNQRKVLIMGMLREKDVKGVVDEIASLTKEIWVTVPQSPRALDLEALAAEFLRYNIKVKKAEKLKEALNEALLAVAEDDLICVVGSLYLAAEALKFFNVRLEKCCVL
jgi:dihydrofolate synthase/folylpolyglutamate synthase